MIYIVMCGGEYPKFDTPRQLLKVNGEPIAARTIRLLRENGIKDIFVSATDERFKQLGVPMLVHDNGYRALEYNVCEGYWCDGFYPTTEPVCYVFGDVVFSPAAIKTIVETETDDVAFFGSAWPWPAEYPKPWIEPYGFKVVNLEHFWKSIEEVKRIDKAGGFNRKPIAWELWNVINGGPDPNYIFSDSYVHINDWTCDIDKPEEIPLLERLARYADG